MGALVVGAGVVLLVVLLVVVVVVVVVVGGLRVVTGGRVLEEEETTVPAARKRKNDLFSFGNNKEQSGHEKSKKYRDKLNPPRFQIKILEIAVGLIFREVNIK